MTLLEWQKVWDQLAKDDPLWIVLTDPSKKGGLWEPNEFFATGEREIQEHVIDYLKSRNLPLPGEVCLDFGCAVGRLSQALALHFRQVHGVDISPLMLEHARRFNRFGDKVQYHLNTTQKLADFKDGSVDFVYSNIVLQHIEPKHAMGFIGEFMRVLRPGGLAIFQVIESTFLRGMVPQMIVDVYRKVKQRGRPFFGMYGLSQNGIEGLVRTRGGEVLDVQRTPYTRRWISCRFCVRKN